MWSHTCRQPRVSVVTRPSSLYCHLFIKASRYASSACTLHTENGKRCVTPVHTAICIANFVASSRYRPESISSNNVNRRGAFVCASLTPYWCLSTCTSYDDYNRPSRCRFLPWVMGGERSLPARKLKVLDESTWKTTRFRFIHDGTVSERKSGTSRWCLENGQAKIRQVRKIAKMWSWCPNPIRANTPMKQQQSLYGTELCGLSNIRLTLSSADDIGVQPSLSALFTSAPACTWAKTRMHWRWLVSGLASE